MKTTWFKGKFGEFSVNLLLKSRLDKKNYHLLKNVTIPTKNGTTQIDHIIVSKFGVFVIETKNKIGWIIGNPDKKIWIQNIYGYSHTFQNPLHQNYKHVKALESLINLTEQQIYSVIVFVGDNKFATKMPENVTYGTGLIDYIKSKKTPILTESQIEEIIKKIKQNRIAPSFKTNREHIRNVKKIIAEKNKINKMLNG